MTKKEMKAIKKMNREQLQFLLKDARLTLMKLKTRFSDKKDRIRKRRLRHRIARILGELKRRENGN